MSATGGNMPLGIAAWVITGLLMIFCSAQFAVMATRYEKVSGASNATLIDEGATTRGMYAIAARGEGHLPRMFGQVDKATNLTGGWFGLFNFDSSELPVVTIYAMYIPIFIIWMKREKELGFVKRFVLPALATIACAFMVLAAMYAHGITPYLTAGENGKFSFPVLFYLIVFAVIMFIGTLLRKGHKSCEEE